MGVISADSRPRLTRQDWEPPSTTTVKGVPAYRPARPPDPVPASMARLVTSEHSYPGRELCLEFPRDIVDVFLEGGGHYR